MWELIEKYRDSLPDFVHFKWFSEKWMGIHPIGQGHLSQPTKINKWNDIFINPYLGQKKKH